MGITYIVTGYMRSGTSMMMRALEAGGLEIAHDPERGRDGEHFYELANDESRVEGFLERHEGKLVKALRGQTSEWSRGDYHVVFMTREPDEIYDSFWKIFKTVPDIPQADYWETMMMHIAYLQNRPDIRSMTVAHYNGVLKAPRLLFDMLVREGWPIDPAKAAAVIDPTLRRNDMAA